MTRRSCDQERAQQPGPIPMALSRLNVPGPCDRKVELALSGGDRADGALKLDGKVKGRREVMSEEERRRQEEERRRQEEERRRQEEERRRQERDIPGKAWPGWDPERGKD